MPKTLSSLLLGLALVLPLVAQDSRVAVGPNLALNPGAERTNAEGQPLYWTTSVWGGQADFERDATGGREGAAFLIRSETGANVSWSQRVRVTPDTDYRFRAWVRLDGIAKTAGHGVLINPHELGLPGRSRGHVGDRDWFLLETTFNAGARDSILFNLTVGGWGSVTGTARFDDIEIHELAEPAPNLDAAAAEAHFRERVLPLFRRHCFDCHGPESELDGGLFLAARTGLLRGGASGPSIDLERPRRSLILSALRYETFEMPPDRKLPESEVEDVLLWIRTGAPFPADLAAARPEVPEAAEGIDIEGARAEHWAFQPLAPATAEAPQVAVDHHVDAALAARGLTASAPADPRTLVRRLAYDLTGLPPDADTVEAFAADPSESAWAALVDHYLDSPHYGERWGRHWLDLVRYAETNSFERDGRKPFVWRYRDWVIRAFEDDMPYDQFVTHQLAGDEIDAPTRESRIATGYYRLGAWDDEPADAELARYDELDDIIATTSQTVLGLTMNCARCHDHKIDPITQRDYYAFLAFFRGVRRYGDRSSDSVEEASLHVIATEEERRVHRAATEEHKAALARHRAIMDEVEAVAKADFAPVEHEDFRAIDRRLDLVEKRVPKLISPERFTAYRNAFEEHRRLKRNPPEGLAQALVVKERGPSPPETHLLVRGLPAVKGPRVEPQFPSVLGGSHPLGVSARDEGASSGRRLALARWMVSPENPLTARVWVNRVWQHHFGRGLVATSSDFGLQGAAPSHPELLDLLTRTFLEGGWRTKPLHRLILTSRAWRRSVVPADAKTAERDPDGVWLSRFRLRRLSAEEIRDSILSVNERLNRERFGASIHPPIPAEVLAGQSRPGAGWPVSPPGERDRRSIYVHVKRSLALPLLAAHDAADTDFSCPVRHESLQPTQALSFMNGEFLEDSAGAFARAIAAALPEASTRTRIEEVLRRVTQAPPSRADVDRLLRFHGELRENEGMNAADALRAVCLLAYNLNAFCFID